MVVPYKEKERDAINHRQWSEEKMFPLIQVKK